MLREIFIIIFLNKAITLFMRFIPLEFGCCFIYRVDEGDLDQKKKDEGESGPAAIMPYSP